MQRWVRNVMAIGMAAAMLGHTVNGQAAEQPADPQQQRQSSRQALYVGTYTHGASEGIYRFEFDAESGKLSNRQLVARTTNPSFLALSTDGGFLYAVNETGTGELSSFAIQRPKGTLKHLNTIAAGGGAPCHLILNTTNRIALVANYTGGNVSASSIRSDGSLGEQKSLIQHSGHSKTKRQQAPHAHSINLSPDQRFAIAADLGTDKLYIYRLSDAGRLTGHSALSLPAGSGPRHFSFHPNGRQAYVINELANTIGCLTYDAEKGTLQLVDSVSTLPDDFDGTSHTAEVRVSADGRFVYGSNRGHDSIAVFQVQDEGGLKRVQVQPIGGRQPRNFTFSPDGRFLLVGSQGTGHIIAFAIDASTGRLSPTGHKVAVPAPVCLRFDRQAG